MDPFNQYLMAIFPLFYDVYVNYHAKGCINISSLHTVQSCYAVFMSELYMIVCFCRIDYLLVKKAENLLLKAAAQTNLALRASSWGLHFGWNFLCKLQKIL